MENKSTQWEGIIEGKRCRIDYDVAEIFAQGQWIEAQGDDELEIYKAAWKDATTTVLAMERTVDGFCKRVGASLDDIVTRCRRPREESLDFMNAEETV